MQFCPVKSEKFSVLVYIVKATLFYDGRCPLCSKEIQWLEKLVGHRLHFKDIHQLNENSAYPSKEVLLRRLHLRTADGQWLIGLDATAYAWSKTALGFLFKLIRIWPMRCIADALYNYWADRRYRQRYDCERCIK